MTDNHGKQYSLKLFSLAKEQQEKTFFCSQLVAACYMALGVMDANRKSHEFWPGDFSQENKLNLKDCVLGDECLINFTDSAAA